MKLSTLACQAVLAALLLPADVLAFSNIASTKKKNERSSPSLQMSSSANQEHERLPVIHNMDRRSAIMGTIGTVIFANNSNMNIASATVTNANNIPNWTLDNNVQFPVLALNTVALTAEETERALGYATLQGIRHVDFHPGKERDGVALYLKNHPEARKDLFLNTKIRKAPPGTSAADAAAMARKQIEEDIGILGVDQVDMLMLRDSPDCDVIQAQWKVMEEALASGKTRSIGVINFCEKALTCVLETATVKPAINYFMWHVGMGGSQTTGRKLREFGESRGIRTFAYGAVGEPGPNDELLSNTVVKEIAKAHKKDPSEVALKWVLQSGCAVSSRPTLNFGLGNGACSGETNACEIGLKKRAGVFDWSLSNSEMKKLDALTSPNDNPTLFSSAGCPNAFVMPKK